MKKPTRILIVEDTAADAELAKHTIRKVLKDCEFQVVKTRKDFLKMLETFQPDVILSDYSLPRFNGMKALKLALEHAPLTPLIIWTGSISEDVAVDCMKAGANNYILKENIKRLGPAVIHALEERQLLLERKQAEEKYQAIFANSVAGVFQSTPEGRYRNVNTAMARIYGYDSPSEMIKEIKSIADQIYVDPARRSEFVRLLHSQGIVENYEERNYRKDGSIIWISTSARAVRDENGNVLYYEGFITDITPRKRAEENLKERERQLTILFGNLPGPVYRCRNDADYTMEFVSDSIAELSGYQPEDFRQHRLHFGKMIHPNDREQVWMEIQTAVERNQPFELTYRIITATGEEKWVWDKGQGIWDSGGQLQALEGFITDITERKQAEEALRNNEKRFRALIENGLDNISLLAVDGTLIWESPAATRMLDYAPDEFVGRNIFELMHPDDIGWTRDLYIKLVQAPGDHQRGTFRLRHSDGTWRWVEAIVTNMLNEPSVDAIVVNYRDITERKQADEDLRKAQARIDSVLANVTDTHILFDRQWRYLYVNEAGLRAMGRPVEEILGHTLWELYPEIIGTELDKRYHRAMDERQSIDFEFYYSTARTWWENHFHPTSDGLAVFATNITERKQAEEKLRLSDQILQRVNALVLVADSQGSIVYASPAARIILGYEPDELLGDNWWKLSRAGLVEAQNEKEYVGQAARGEVSIPSEAYERPIRDRWGNTRWISWVDAAGPGDLLIGVGHDITQRKQIEARINDLLAFNEKILNHSPVGILTYKLTGQCVFANENAASIVGAQVEQLKAQNFHTIAAWKKSGLYALVQKAITTQAPVTDDIHHVSTFGKDLWMTAHCVTFKSKDEEHVLLAISDITERRNAEEALRESENRLILALSGAQMSVWEWDLQTNHILWSPEFFEITGVKENDFGGTFESFTHLIHNEDIERVMDSAEKAVADKTLFAEEFRILRPDGEVRWLSNLGHAEYDPTGDHLRLIGTVQDITQRKQAEIERQVLLEIMQGFADTKDLNELLTLIHHSIARVIYAENFFVVLYQPDSGLFEEIYSVDQYDPLAPPARLEKSITSYIFRSGEPILLTQALFDELAAQGEVELVGTNSASWLGVPLKTSDRTIGVMAVQDYENDNRYSERDRDFLASIATQIALAIEHREAGIAVRESEERHRSLFEHMLSGYAHCQMLFDENNKPVDFIYINVNAAFEESTGLKGVEGQKVSEVIPGIQGSNPELFEVYGRVAVTGKPERFETQVASLGIWFSISVYSPKPGYFVAVFDNITERRQAEDGEREQRALAEALRDTAETLNSTLDYGEVLDRILAASGHVVPHDAASIMLIDEGFAHVVRSQGYKERGFNTEVMEIKLPVAETTNLRQMLETGQPVIVSDTQSYTNWKKLSSTDWLRSNVGAPISIYGKVIGFILLDSETPGFFTPVHAERLEAFANQAALAIHNARLLQQAQEEITERKQAENELRFEKERLESIAATVPGIICSFRLRPDGSACMPFASPAIQEVYGFLPTDLQQDITPLLARIHPDDLPHNNATIAESARTMLPWHNEYRYRHPTKGETWIEGQSVPLREEDGSIIWHGFVYDITERKRAESELRASEERFRQLADNIQEVFWMTDAESGEELYISPAVEAIWGRQAETLIHEPRMFIDSIFPEDQPAVLHAIEKEKNGENVELEYRIVRPDGSLRWIWDRAFPIFDDSGKVKRIAGISADITERRASELALIKSQSRYRELFDSSPISIWEEDFSLVKERIDILLASGVTDLKEYLFSHPDEVVQLASSVRINDVNRASLELYRVEEKEHLLKTLTEALGKETIGHFQEEILGLLSPVKRFTWEGTEKTLDGRQMEVIVTGSIPYGHDEDWSKVIVSISDITERKRAEEEVRRRAGETSALLETSLALTNLELEATLQTVGNSAKTLFAADGCRIFLIEPDGESLRCVLALQENFAAFSNLRIKIGDGVTGAVAISGRAEIVNEMQNDPRAVQVPGTLEKEEEAVMFAPLRERDRTIGILSIRRAGTERPFEPADLELLEAFASMAASAVSNARLFEETQRRLAELEALYENGLAVGRLLEPREIGERIIETFARNLSWHHVTIRLKQPESDELELIAFNQPGLSDAERTEIEHHFNAMVSTVGQGMSGWVVQTGAPLRAGDVHAHSQYVDTHTGIRSGLYMPLKLGERVIGVISVESETPDAFTEQDERLLATLASQAAIAFENARLYQAVEQELSERKRVEQELRESQERFQNLFENSPIDTWLEDFSAVATWMDELRAQGVEDLRDYLAANPEELKHGVGLIRILNVNHAAVVMNGAHSKEELISKVHDLMLDEYSRQIMVNEFEMIWKGLTSFGFETYGRKLDGSIVSGVQRIFVPVKDGSPEFERLIVTSTDISDRVNIEEALRASETHYRELADSITDILFELDQNLRYTHWNKASEALTGITVSDAIGRSMLEVFGETEEQSRIGKIYEDVLKNRQPRTFETTIVLNEEKRSFEINAYPSTRGVSVVAKDVTERKKSESIMQKRFELMEYSAHHSLDELMQKTVDEVSELTGSTIGFFHFVEEDQITLGMQTWSTNALQLFNVPVSEGAHLPLDQAGVWAEAVHQRRPLIQNDYVSLSKKKDMPQGHVPMLREIVIPILRNEKIVAVMGIGNKPQNYTQYDLEIAERLADYAWDITERKRMEAALAEERNQLARRVEERTSDLSRANSNLARALRVKDEFLANMSHELRTPLNAILGLSESLGEQIAGPLNEKQQKYITTISESGHHLLSLINDILDLAKIEAGQIKLDINKVDINSVCQASLRMVKQLAQKKDQEVTLEIDNGLGLMWADERRLKQMIVNLLGNAVKFTPENGKIGLEVHGDEEANKVTITVWDNGIGIKEDDLTHLFQPFVQLDAGLARGATGTGLGLALVAQMARLHGGSVSAFSEPGKGSRFSVILPWEPALALDAATRLKITGKFRAIKTDETNKPTILLVEDTKEVTMMVKDYLELAGYKMVTAQDGVDAIVQAKLARPDLILMDVQMPRMDGLEATRKLRSEPDFRYTPIIALTALAMPKDRENCLAAGMDEYISKPVNLKALVKIIQSCLFNEETK